MRNNKSMDFSKKIATIFLVIGVFVAGFKIFLHFGSDNGSVEIIPIDIDSVPEVLTNENKQELTLEHGKSKQNDYKEIIRNSGYLELCELKASELSREISEYEKSNKYSNIPLDSLEDVLNAKVSENEISKREAYNVYMSLLNARDEFNNVTITKSQLKEKTQQDKFADDWNARVSEIISSPMGYSGIDKNNIQDSRILLSRKLGFASLDTMIIDRMDDIDPKRKELLIKNYKFDLLSIDSAIRKSYNSGEIKTMLSLSGEGLRYYNAGRRGMQKILLTSLTSGNHDVSKLIIAEFPERKSKFLPSSVDMYLIDLVKAGEFLEKDQKNIEIIKEYGLFPSVFIEQYNSILERNKIKKIDVPSDIVNLVKYFQENDNIPSQHETFKANDSESARYINELFDIKQREKNTKAECKELKQKRDKLEPLYADNLAAIESVKSVKSYSETILILSKISPSLVDYFISELSESQERRDIIEVEQWLKNYGYKSFEELLDFGNNLFPNQQSYIFSKTCDKLSSDQIIRIIDNNWVIDTYKVNNAICVSNELVKSAFLKNKNSEPGVLYTLIKNFEYNKSIDYLNSSEFNLQGFPHGRDALMLLLDRMILFKMANKKQEFKLLELLVEHTDLNKFHYEKLHRLQLKYPTYFDSLTSRYPKLADTKKYQLSLYSSFL